MVHGPNWYTVEVRISTVQSKVVSGQYKNEHTSEDNLRFREVPKTLLFFIRPDHKPITAARTIAT